MAGSTLLDVSLILTSTCCLHCLVSFLYSPLRVESSMLSPPCFLLVDPSVFSPSWCLLHVVSSYSCVSRLGESSLIGGASADRLTNSLFINGLSVPGSQGSQRTIQFSSIQSIDFMSPCRAIFITGIKTLIKDKKIDITLMNSACTSEQSLHVVYLLALGPCVFIFFMVSLSCRMRCINNDSQQSDF